MHGWTRSRARARARTRACTHPRACVCASGMSVRTRARTHARTHAHANSRLPLRAHECKPSISRDLQHARTSSFVWYRSLCIKEIDGTQKMSCTRAIDREILQFMQCLRASHSRLHAQKPRACARWPEKPQIFARRGADKHRQGAPPCAESHRPPSETVRHADSLNLKRVVLEKYIFPGTRKGGFGRPAQKKAPNTPMDPPTRPRYGCVSPRSHYIE
jgi:hypothetical protein